MVYSTTLIYIIPSILLLSYTHYPCIGILIEFIQYSAHNTYHAFFYFRVDTYNDIKIHTYFGSVRITYIKLFFIGVYYIVTL